MWALVGWWRRGRRALPDGRWFLRAAAIAGPAAFIALEAGWIVTEVGRQPWIVYGQMRTADAVTTRGGIIWWLLATVGTYLLLGAACSWLLVKLARQAARRGDERGTGQGARMSATALEVDGRCSRSASG